MIRRYLSRRHWLIGASWSDSCSSTVVKGAQLQATAPPLNFPYRPKQGKELARTLIAGDRLLTVPVEGGASRLKRSPQNLSEIMISDHGAWRREHLGAWNAVYGKTPFFPYLYPLIEEAYENNSHRSLAEFNDALWKIALDFIRADETLSAVREMAHTNPERLEAIKTELTTKVNLNYSIFDAIFRLGKNVIFLL